MHRDGFVRTRIWRDIRITYPHIARYLCNNNDISVHARRYIVVICMPVSPRADNERALSLKWQSACMHRVGHRTVMSRDGNVSVDIIIFSPRFRTRILTGAFWTLLVVKLVFAPTRKKITFELFITIMLRGTRHELWYKLIRGNRNAFESSNPQTRPSVHYR